MSTIETNLFNFEQFNKFLSHLTKYDSQHKRPLICTQAFPHVKAKHTSPYIFWDFVEPGISDMFNGYVQECSKRNLYVSVAINEMGRLGKPLGDLEQFERRQSEVSRIRALVLDVDLYISPNVAKKLMLALKPTFYVRSSVKDNKVKLHLYFLIGQVSKEFNQQLIDGYHTLQQALATRADAILSKILQEQPPEQGWCDRSITLEKALRCPGFVHNKDPEHARVVTYAECAPGTSHSCEIVEKNFKEFLLRVGITKELLEEIENSRRNRKKALEIDTDAIGTGYKGAEDGNRHNSLYEFMKNLIDYTDLPEGCYVAIAKQADLEAHNPPFQDNPDEEDEPERIVKSIFANKLKNIQKK